MRILTILCCFFTQMIFASFDMNRNVQESYSYIINLEFEKANILLENEFLENPDNGFIPLYKNYIDFLTIIITEESNYFNSCHHMKKNRLRLLEKNDQQSPYYLYSQAEINLQWAFAHLKFKRYPTAIYELIKSYKLLEKNQKKFPNFNLNNKCLGLIHAILGAVPDQFQWLVNAAGLKGSVSLGLSQLGIILDDNDCKMYKEEVLFLLSFLQINLGNNNSLCQKYLDIIGDDYKDNLLLTFAAARLSNHLGKNDYCLQVLENRSDNSKSIKFYYLDYLQAMSYLYKLDYIKAKQKFEIFLANFKGSNYIKSANHKLACIAYLENNNYMQSIYFEKTITNGSSFIDEDKVAFLEAKNNCLSPPRLLKARLLYDGGYYSVALEQLNQIEYQYFSSGIHQIEYLYRLARVKSKLDYSQEILIENYKKVLDFKADSSYYVPMSALQIALIYEEMNNITEAESFYNQCLSISGFDYQRGIHQKARAGLERILN